jgi:hypothetical protein
MVGAPTLEFCVVGFVGLDRRFVFEPANAFAADADRGGRLFWRGAVIGSSARSTFASEAR